MGDVMLGSAFPDESGLPLDDAASLLAEVTPLLSSADVAFGNLEGPLADGGTSEKCARSRPGRCYAFRSPTRYARHLADAGFDVLGLANNHAGDFGAEGRESTRRALDAAGLAHAGEPGDVARLRVKERRLAVVAFATSDATLDLRDLEGAKRVVAGLAAENDLVVVAFHGGAEGAAYQHVPPGREEFLGEDRGDLRAFAHAVVEAGAALVVGSGPHVVRGMEVYRGRLVAYSLGNFATYGSFNLSGPNGLSLVLEARLGPDGAFLGGRVHPVRQEKPGGPRLDPQGQVIPLLRSLSEADFGESAVRVEADGTLVAPGHSSKPSAGSERSGLPSSAAAMRAASNRP
ncbi:MAG TPA: CapA family protein [Anaeromyxobacteraceae bacterium]|nr:CapA family protein [Anaeromyxobacteraceae bacterium]